MFGIDDVIIGMAISGAIAGGSSLAGGIMANDARQDAANSANQWGLWMQRENMMHQNEMANFNARQSEMAREWMANMSNSAYQRGMLDMRMAGLNPILAYQQGGATSPSASGASGSAGAGFTPGAKADIQDVISPAVSSGMNAVRTIQGIQSAQEEIKQTQANTALQQVQAGREAAATGNLLQQTATEAERTGLVSRQAATEAAREGLVQAETGAAAARAGLDRQSELTERERTVTEGWRAYREQAEGNSAWQRYRWDRDWGPSSPVRDPAVSAEQIQQRIDRAMQQGLGPYLRIGQ